MAGGGYVAGSPAIGAPCRALAALERDGVARAAAVGAGLGACGADRREQSPDRLWVVLIRAGGVDVEEQLLVDVVAGEGQGLVDRQGHRDPSGFGTESTCPGGPGRQLVERATRAGYRVEGVYIGTESAAINVERVEHRVASRTGHQADVAKLPEDWAASMSALREVLDQLDELEILDNSAHHADRRPRPVDQVYIENGLVTWEAETLRTWCARWLGR